MSSLGAPRPEDLSLRGQPIFETANNAQFPMQSRESGGHKRREPIFPRDICLPPPPSPYNHQSKQPHPKQRGLHARQPGVAHRQAAAPGGARALVRRLAAVLTNRRRDESCRRRLDLRVRVARQLRLHRGCELRRGARKRRFGRLASARNNSRCHSSGGRQGLNNRGWQ